MKKLSVIIMSLLFTAAPFAVTPLVASADSGVPPTGVNEIPGWVIPLAIVAVVALLVVILLPQILKKKK